MYNGHIDFDMRCWRELDIHRLRECPKVDMVTEIATIFVSPNVEKWQHDKKIVVVYGPVWTGLLGHQGEHLKRLRLVTRKLETNGHFVFDLNPFERVIENIIGSKANLDGHCDPRVLRFYQQLLGLRLITGGFFLEGWQTSKWAFCARERLTEAKLTVTELPTAVVDKIVHEELQPH